MADSEGSGESDGPETKPAAEGDEVVPGMGRRRVIGSLFLIVFIDLLGFGILLPVIPLNAKFFGANEFVGSLLIATYSAFQFVGAPVLGRVTREPVRIAAG